MTDSARTPNSFDSLRLFGAVLVLVGHAFIITGRPAITAGGMPIHSIGVLIFFVISGFLITQSWTADPSLMRYSQKRFLRIWPALAVMLILTALVIGPLASSVSVNEFFQQKALYRYVLKNAILWTDWGIPTTFSKVAVRSQFNGSLWTLPVETFLYCLVPLLTWLCARRPRWTIPTFGVLAILILVAFSIRPQIYEISRWGLNFGWALKAAPFFIMGSLLQLAGFQRWRKSLGVIGIMTCIAAVVCWLAFGWLGPWVEALALVPFSILLLELGLSHRLFSNFIKSIGDVSYGVYLWAYPVQQLVELRIGGSPLMNIAISLPTTLALAYASWHLIEKQALRLKPRRAHGPRALV